MTSVDAAVAGLPRSGALYVGLSGGMDSVVLLHACATAGLPVTAIHVHHGISPHADAWQQFCADLCGSFKVDLIAERVSVSRKARTSLEEEARRARYAAFERQVPAGGTLLLAHHADDQAETVLLQLLRGAGPAGWGGMAPAQSWRGRQVLRPFLALPRRALSEYATAHQLRWIEDESNADLRYKRNYLRHEVMPRLEASFPAVAGNLARAAELAREAAELAQGLAIADLQQVAQDASLHIPTLLTLGDARARGVLRAFLAEHQVRAPSQRRLAELLRQLTVANSDTRLRWEHEGVVLVQNGAWLTSESASRVAQS